MRSRLIAISVAVVSMAAIVSMLAGTVAAQSTQPATQPTRYLVGQRVQVIMIEGGNADGVIAAHHATVDELGNLDVPDVGMVAVTGADIPFVERTIGDVLKMDKKMRLPLVATAAMPEDKNATKIANGDTLGIIVKQTEGRFLQGREMLKVNDQGVISSKSLGAYQAAGLTENELQTLIARSLAARQIMKKPEVFIVLNPTTRPTP